MISARGLHRTYRGAGVPALDGVNLDLAAGELVALIGHNGAGKSTLFDLLGGLSKPDSGTIRRDVPSHVIGWCPQRTVIDWSLTVRQNITLALELRGHRETRRAVEEVIEVLGLTKYVSRQAETLSGGELQRAQIARAIAGAPDLMILDEPTTGLDPDAIRVVMEYLRGLVDNGAAALVSTHETSRFLEHCDRVVALHRGTVVADLPVREFMSAAPGSDDLWVAYLSRTERLEA